jgi:hypothetical protein
VRARDRRCARACAGFQESLTLDAVIGLPSLDDVNGESAPEPFWIEMCESISDEPRLADLRSAAFMRLPTSHPRSTACQDQAARLITIEAPSGAAVALLPASASDLLPVPVTSR